jgi:hypothetical protein
VHGGLGNRRLIRQKAIMKVSKPPLSIPAVIAFILVFAVMGCSRKEKPKPSPPVLLPLPDLSAKPGPRIREQLRQLRIQPRQCFALLGRVKDLEVRSLPDTNEQPGCSMRFSAEILESPIAFTKPTKASCALIASLYLWQREVVTKAAATHLASPVVKIETFGTYACRPRNNRPEARLSEHATANAVDISAFILANGRKISVKNSWYGGIPQERAFLRAVHQASCRYFSAVLGPDADRFHQDHFHLDTGPFTVCQ